jgi:phosphosulfolactate synthase (CoM biosynthesis protein A)
LPWIIRSIFSRSRAATRNPGAGGLTSIGGPYYTPVGPRYLADLLGAMGGAVDTLKYAAGAFAVMRADTVRRLNRIAREHDVAVSTGGFIERVVAWGDEHVEPYLHACRSLDFDIVEVSSGFIAIAEDEFARLIERVRLAGLRAVAEVGIQRGAGGSSAPDVLERAGTIDPEAALRRAERALDAGAELIIVESEGITEQVREWRKDVPRLFAERLGIERLLFEAAEPRVFEWYIRAFGADVNLFIDHSQIVRLEALRAGAWGPAGMWGREY